MKFLSSVFTSLLCLLAVGSFAQKQTARQLYDEYHSNEYTFEKKYLNKQLIVEGKIRSIKQGIKGFNEANVVFITATGYENFIYCQFPLDDTLPLSRLKANEVVTVTGQCSRVVRDAMLLTNSNFSTANNKTTEVKKAVPVNIPLGLYHVYQSNGTSFNFQYKFVLKSYSSYTTDNVEGSVDYDAKSKVIRFKSGKLKGFTGIYRAFNPDNEKDPPTIVMDVKGVVPDLSHQYGKTYLLAYLQDK
jgi:hypothetical protein